MPSATVATPPATHVSTDCATLRKVVHQIEDQPTLPQWRNAIIVAFALGGITVAAWGPRLPAIRAALGVNTGTLGIVLACATVGSIGGLLAARPLLHRLGGRRAILTTLTCVAAALGVMAAGLEAGSVIVLGVGLTAVGVGLGALDVSINVEGAAVERKAGRTLLPLMHAGWSGGAALGAGIGAGCAAAGIAPATQFLGTAIIVWFTGATVSRAIPAAVPADDHEPAAVAEQRSARVRRWLRSWNNRRLLLIGVVLFGVEFGEGSANSWLTLAVKENHGRSSAVAALFFTVFAISEATTRVIGGPFVDRFGRVRTIQCTTVAGICGIALFILGGSPVLVVTGTVLWAVGVSMGFPLGNAAAAESGDDPAAQVSVAASVGYFSSLVGPPTIGFLAESIGLGSSLWLIAIMFVAAFACAGALASTRRAR